MSCTLLNGGISLTCDGNVGGIKKIYLTNHENVTGLTLNSPDGKISAINMASGTLFYEFAFTKGSSNFTEVTSGDAANGTQPVVQTVTLKLNRREKTKRDTLALLMGFRPMIAICTDNNGLNWLLGEVNGLVMTQNQSETGTATTDGNFYTLTLVGDETAQANEVVASAITAVI